MMAAKGVRRIMTMLTVLSDPEKTSKMARDFSESYERTVTEEVWVLEVTSVLNDNIADLIRYVEDLTDAPAATSITNNLKDALPIGDPPDRQKVKWIYDLVKGLFELK